MTVACLLKASTFCWITTIYQKLKHMSAADLKDLIQQVLKNPEFNIDEVDHDMHERLQRAIDIGDIDVTDFWQEGES